MGQGCTTPGEKHTLKVNDGMLEAFQAITDVEPRLGHCKDIVCASHCAMGVCGEGSCAMGVCAEGGACCCSQCEEAFVQPCQNAAQSSSQASRPNLVVLRPSYDSHPAMSLHTLVQAQDGTSWPLGPVVPQRHPGPEICYAQTQYSREVNGYEPEFTPRSCTTADSECSLEAYNFETGPAVSTERPSSVPPLAIPVGSPFRKRPLQAPMRLSPNASPSGNAPLVQCGYALTSEADRCRKISSLRDRNSYHNYPGPMKVSKPCAPVLRYERDFPGDDVEDWDCPGDEPWEDPAHEASLSDMQSLERMQEYLASCPDIGDLSEEIYDFALLKISEQKPSQLEDVYGHVLPWEDPPEQELYGIGLSKLEGDNQPALSDMQSLERMQECHCWEEKESTQSESDGCFDSSRAQQGTLDVEAIEATNESGRPWTDESDDIELTKQLCSETANSKAEFIGNVPAKKVCGIRVTEWGEWQAGSDLPPAIRERSRLGGA